MRHARPVSVARATTTDADLERFREIFLFRVIVALTAVVARKN